VIKLAALAALPPGAVQIAQQATGTSSADLTIFVQYGVLGVFVALFLTGRIVTSRHVEQRDAEIERLRAELDERARVAEERMIPALVEATRVLAAYLEQEARRSRGKPQ
jgi:hypothetical protein